MSFFMRKIFGLNLQGFCFHGDARKNGVCDFWVANLDVQFHTPAGRRFRGATPTPGGADGWQHSQGFGGSGGEGGGTLAVVVAVLSFVVLLCSVVMLSRI